MRPARGTTEKERQQKLQFGLLPLTSFRTINSKNDLKNTSSKKFRRTKRKIESRSSLTRPPRATRVTPQSHRLNIG